MIPSFFELIFYCAIPVLVAAGVGALIGALPGFLFGPLTWWCGGGALVGTVIGIILMVYYLANTGFH